MSIVSNTKSEPRSVPQHVAIIMDGNGRWAQQKGLSRIEGHKAGVDSVLKVVEAAAHLGVRHLTLYAFSTENWKRPEAEVKGLMSLLSFALDRFFDRLVKQGVQLRTIGDTEALPKPVQKSLARVIEKSKSNSEIIVSLALNYGGRQEITLAARKLAEKVEQGQLSSSDIDESTFASQLYNSDIPDPELLIRTSGELRLSNYLLWQLSYAEFYITDTYWPDFGADEFKQALCHYQERNRRFGGV